MLVNVTVTLGIINVILWSRTPIYTTQWYTYVYQTWQRVNYLSLPQLGKCRNSSWRLLWLHHLGSHYDQNPHVWSLVKHRQFSCHCIFACQGKLDPFIWAETLAQSHLLAWMQLPSLPPSIWGTKNLWSCSVQFSSVAQSCPTLWDPMNGSMPGLPVHNQLPEFTQTHLHRVGDAIQPSHPLSPPYPTPNRSQNQSLFQWVNSLHEVAKVLEFQL